MATSSAFTPKASLTEAPTNLKEAIDWVLRVTGRDGKALSDDECICGLAAAVTDLLQSVQLEYHGYQGESKGAETTQNKGASQKEVTNHLNGLFSLVQGLGGTAVVRTYIDQLAQVLSALVGWSRITKCGNGGSEKCKVGGNGNEHGTKDGCEYLKDVKHENKCDKCGCMKWDATSKSSDWVQLGRGCTKCDGDKCGKAGGGGCTCQCKPGGNACNGAAECKCDNKCECTIGTYRSAYRGLFSFDSTLTGETITVNREATWKDLNTITSSRSKCAQILLGSVCLIWSGLTYMYWTGKYHKSSPRWNNHILDGSGLDDGTLSQWLQALGFPVTMLNNHGPGNRWDAIIWDGIRDMLFLGFPDTSSGSNGTHGKDDWDNSFRQPAGMNYAGYLHTVDRGAFCSKGNVFRNGDGSSTSEENINKCGALYKLYVLSCAYFTGLQKKAAPKAENKTPKTIREILYWLSALPYSQAYKKILEHSKGILERVAPDVGDKKQLSFYQTGRTAPITVDDYNLFAHFQAVTQYCPLVLIGIQGGIHSTNTTTPAIHSLYANTECNFTYPTVDIQAYNQVVHYIRALFYQLYFLRKQCAVKVTCGGKWRECRYGSGVVSKGVISWMCLGCSPMEHDRKSRVEKVKGVLDGVKTGSDLLILALKTLLEAIGNVVVQLGNAQEALEGKKKEAILGVKEKLQEAKDGLEKARRGLEAVKKGGLDEEKLKDAKNKLGELSTNGGGKLGEVGEKLGTAASDVTNVDPGKNKISEAINGVCKALEALKEGLEKYIKKRTSELLEGKMKLSHVLPVNVSLDEENALLDAIKDLLSLCNSPKCPGCTKHGDKCGKTPTPSICQTCLQPTTTGVPSPLQAFLEDRLPGFSCEVVRNNDTDQPYPPAASHLGHCNGSGQCCPLPMGFRGQFHKGSTGDMTGSRLYGILYFFSNENMMQSCVYTLVRVTAALSSTTPQVLGDVFGFFRGGVGEKESGKNKKGNDGIKCQHEGDPSNKGEDKYFCGWCASGLREEVKKIEWIQNTLGGKDYRKSVGEALIAIKGEKGSDIAAYSSNGTSPSALSALTKDSEYLSPLTGELYTAVSATFGRTYLSWVLYLSDALEGGLKSLASAFQEIECRGCRECDPNKCKKGEHGQKSNPQDAKSTPLCQCQSIVSCTGVLPVLYRHGFSYGNPFNLEGYEQKEEEKGDYSITDRTKETTKHCHEFLESLSKVLEDKQNASKDQDHPLTELLKQVGKLQYDIRLPWIFVLTIAWLVAVLYLAFGAIWPLDWTHMRSHWLRGGEHQWQCMWYKVMTGRKGVELVEYFGRM